MPECVRSNILAVSSLVLALALSTAAGAPSAVSAQDTSEPGDRALVLARDALDLYRAGRLEEAVALLGEARTLAPEEPLLAYNLARAYEALGRLEEARDAYQTYLDLAPDAAERGAVEVRIASLEVTLAERARLAAEEQRARDEAAAARRAARALEPVPWIVAAVGAGAIAAGGVTAGFAVEGREHALRTEVHQTRVERFEEAQRLSVAANVLFAVGGTVALAGLVWGLVQHAITPGDDESGVALQVWPGGVGCSGRF